MPDPTRTLTCNIGTSTAARNDLIAAVERLSIQSGWAPRDLVAVQVTLDEVLSNIIKYAALIAGATIRVDVRSEESLIEISVRDEGVAFDPLNDHQSEQSRTDRGIAIGGRGIGLVRELMKEVVYTRDGNTNVLTMVRPRLARAIEQ